MCQAQAANPPPSPGLTVGFHSASTLSSPSPVTPRLPLSTRPTATTQPTSASPRCTPSPPRNQESMPSSTTIQPQRPCGALAGLAGYRCSLVAFGSCCEKEGRHCTNLFAQPSKHPTTTRHDYHLSIRLGVMFYFTALLAWKFRISAWPLPTLPYPFRLVSSYISCSPLGSCLPVMDIMVDPLGAPNGVFWGLLCEGLSGQLRLRRATAVVVTTVESSCDMTSSRPVRDYMDAAWASEWTQTSYGEAACGRTTRWQGANRNQAIDH